MVCVICDSNLNKAVVSLAVEKREVVPASFKVVLFQKYCYKNCLFFEYLTLTSLDIFDIK